MFKIKLCCSFGDEHKYDKIKENLKELNIEVITNDEIIHFDNKEINIASINLITKRDPRSPIVSRLRKELMLIQKEKIIECNALLVMNSNDTIHVNFFHEICFAWILEKQIYVYNDIVYNDLFYNQLMAMDVIPLKKDLTKINEFDNKKTLEEVLSKFSDGKEKTDKIKLNTK